MKNTKALLTLIAILAALALLAGCGTTATTTLATTTAAGTTKAGTDMVATASIVNTNEAFEKAISKNGTWLIATLKDLTFTKDLLVDGDFKNGKKDTAGNDAFQRKIGLYTQDDKFKVTNREVLYRSPIMLTPYLSATKIDTDKVNRFIHEAYEDAGLTPEDVDTGAVIIPGEALKK